MIEIGSIIPIKHFIFRESASKIKTDHPFKNRPCLVIAEDDELYYLLSISSHNSKEEGWRYYKAPEYASTKDCYIDLKYIYTTKIAGYKELNFVDCEDLFDILLQFLECQNNFYQDKLFDNVQDEVLKKINTMKKNVKPKKKMLKK